MINLLPPLYKQTLLAQSRARLATILGLLVFLFVACLSLLFLATRVYLTGELQSQRILIESQQEEYEQNQAPSARIREVNRTMARVQGFYADRVVLSDMLEDISQTLPEGVTINLFTYRVPDQDRAAATVSLEGFAPSTEDLLLLRNNLEENPMFSNFSFPPSNWVNATNIDFSFTFEAQNQ